MICRRYNDYLNVKCTVIRYVFQCAPKQRSLWGFFILITVYQNHSELLQFQKDEAPVNTYVAAIVEKLLF